MQQRIGRNIFSLAFSRIISGVISFVVIVFLSRYLGPTEFGKFSLVVTYFTIFSLLVDLGISRYVIRKVSEDKSLASVYLGNFFLAQSLLSLLVLALFVIIPRALHYGTPITNAMMLAGAGLLFLSLSLPFSSIIQAWQRIHLVAIINFFNTLIYATWLAAAIVYKKDLVFLFWAYAIYGLLDVVAYWLLARKITPTRVGFESALVKKLFLYGIPFAFISGFEILVSKVDVIIQKFFLSFAAIGLYSTAYRFLDALTFIPAVVAISLFPFLSEKKDLRGDTEVTSILNRLNRYMMALAIPLGVGTAILARKIVLTLFHQEYAGATVPLQIMIWAAALTFVYAVPNVIMIVKETRKTVLTLGAVTIFNIVTNIFFIPKFGIVASAWITVLSYVLAAALYFYYSRKLVAYELFRYALWPIFMSAVMGLVLWIWREQNLAILVVLAFLIYFGGLSAVRFFKKDDWEFVKSIFHREPIS